MLNLRFRRTTTIRGAAGSYQKADMSDDAYALRAMAEVGLSARSREREHCSNAGWLSTVERACLYTIAPPPPSPSFTAFPNVHSAASRDRIRRSGPTG